MGGLSALHSPPWPPFPLGDGELIRPAADLPCLAPAEEEPAKPKPLMSEPRLAAGTCLLQGGWSRAAQRSSRTGCACLQRSRDVRPPHRRTTLLLAGRPDTRIPWKPPLAGGLPAPSRGLRAAGELGSQRPAPSTGRRAFVREKADVTRAEELVMWEKGCSGGLKGLFAQPPVWSTRKREKIWACPPAMLRCGCGSAAPLRALRPYQGDVRRGWSHPRAAHCLHKAALRGVLRARIWQVFNRREPLLGKRRRSGRERGSCSPAQAVGWPSHGAHPPWGCSRPGSPGAGQPQPFRAPLRKSVAEQCLCPSFMRWAGRQSAAESLSGAPAWKKWPDNGVLSNFKGVWCPICNTVVSYWGMPSMQFSVIAVLVS